MIFWSRKELIEVEEVIRTASGAGGVAHGPQPVNKSELIKELGDVLFDTLMLIEVASAEFPDTGVSLESCASSACSKVRRRCPYVFDKDSQAAMTVADAEAAWQDAKRREREIESAACAETSKPSIRTAGCVEQAATPSQSSADACEPQEHAAADVGASGGEEDGGLSEWMADFQANTGPPDDDDDGGPSDNEADAKDYEAEKRKPAHQNESIAVESAATGPKALSQAAPSSSSASRSPPAVSPSTTPPRIPSMEVPATGYLSEAEDEDDDDDGGLREWMRDYHHGRGPPSEESCGSEEDI